MSRRRVLMAGGMAVVGGGVAACSAGSGSSAPAPATTDTTSPGSGQPADDLAFAGLAAAIENLLAGTYQSALEAAGDGKLGTVPASVTTLIKTMQSHHRDHAAAWNAILTGAGLPAVTGVDATVQASITQPALASLRSVSALALLAVELEGIASATYLEAVQAGLSTTGALQTAIAIQPVEMQHLAVIELLVSTTPVAGSFASPAGARTVGDSVG